MPPSGASVARGVAVDRICAVAYILLAAGERQARAKGLEDSAMPVVVNHTSEFEVWMDSLTQRERSEIQRVVAMLTELGVLLGFPHSSDIKGSRYPLRELRPKRGDSPLRPIYAFDPHRQALLLIGGDKGADKRMYDRIVPVAETLWERHLRDLAAEDDHDDEDEK